MKRLLSIDTLRGIALAGMILVNNPGDWNHIYMPFEHASFIGLTLADLVFPTFMFVMGFCIPLALIKHVKSSKQCLLHIFQRTIIIFSIGLFLQWMSSGWCSWHELRIPGVLQRLALCYGIVASLCLFMKENHLISISTLILVIYTFILSLFNGYEWSEANICARVDHLLLGVNHLYTDSGLKFDPEGILSTLPSVAHVMIGAYFSMMWLRLKKEHQGDGDIVAFKQFAKISSSMVLTTFILIVCDMISDFPIVKKVWSATFVLTTISIDVLLLTALIWMIDIKGKNGRWSQFFIIFGRNPLLLYVIAWIMADLFGSLGITWNIYDWFCQWFAPCTSSLFYAILFVGLHWLIAFGLYKAKIKISI